MQILTVPTLAHREPARFPDCERILLAYSGGKDSLVCLDLAIQAYSKERVAGYYLYFVEGMDLTKALIAYAWERFGITIRAYPHFFTSEYLRDGQFCDPNPNVPYLSLKDVERVAKKDAGCSWCIYGYRKSDSLERRAMLGHDFPGGICTKWGRVAPLAEFSRKDVLLYSRQHDIAIPSEQELKLRSSNVGLFPSSMWWLREYWPADYQRVLRVFPYARLQAERHEEFLRNPTPHKSPTRSAEASPLGPQRANADVRRWYRMMRWVRLRAQVLQEAPNCERCSTLDPPLCSASVDVDHRRPHHGDPVLFWDRENLQALCKACHTQKTRAEDQGVLTHAAQARA